MSYIGLTRRDSVFAEVKRQIDPVIYSQMPEANRADCLAHAFRMAELAVKMTEIDMKNTGGFPAGWDNYQYRFM